MSCFMAIILKNFSLTFTELNDIFKILNPKRTLQGFRYTRISLIIPRELFPQPPPQKKVSAIQKRDGTVTTETVFPNQHLFHI